MTRLPSLALLPLPAAAGPATPQPDASPPAPACPTLSEAALLAAFQAHYPALLRFCRVEGVGYVLCGHVAAAEGAAVRFALGPGWVLLRLRSDGRVGLPAQALSRRGVAYLLARHLPVRDRRVLVGGPFPEGRQRGIKRAAGRK